MSRLAIAIALKEPKPQLATCTLGRLTATLAHVDCFRCSAAVHCSCLAENHTNLDIVNA